jgi:hypothetical protein
MQSESKVRVKEMLDEVARVASARRVSDPESQSSYMHHREEIGIAGLHVSDSYRSLFYCKQHPSDVADALFSTILYKAQKPSTAFLVVSHDELDSRITYAFSRTTLSPSVNAWPTPKGAIPILPISICDTNSHGLTRFALRQSIYPLQPLFPHADSRPHRPGSLEQGDQLGRMVFDP